MLADVEFCTYMYIYSYQSNLYGSHPVVLIIKQTTLIHSDMYRVILLQLVPLTCILDVLACHRPSSGMSLQKPYKGR